ncbi:MAG TPA: WhiB family transcriptional regulator [Trebonia sp.]|nr:WhiB family transcriptional regulator [Trebonia sp.]
MSEYRTEWRAAGACLSADPDLFFPVATGIAAGREAVRAQRVCAGCQVRQECLDFAMRNGEMHGIWGGTTPDERLHARRQRNRTRRTRPAWRETSAARAS